MREYHIVFRPLDDELCTEYHIWIEASSRYEALKICRLHHKIRELISGRPC